MLFILRPLFVTLISLHCLLIISCSRQEQEVSRAPDFQSRAYEALSKITDESGLIMLSAGDADRRLVRYNLSIDSSEKSAMTLDMQMSMHLNGQEMPAVPMPATIITMSLDVLEHDQDWWKLESRIEEITVGGSDSLPPELREMMREQMSLMEGIRFFWDMNDRGEIRNMELKYEKEIPAQFQQLMDQTTQTFQQAVISLPPEKVGPGAEWIYVLKDLQTSNMRQDVRSYYRVRSLSDKGMDLDVAVVGLIPEQKQEAESPNGITLHVQPSKTRGQGTMSIRFNKVMPDSEITNSGSLLMKATGGPQGEHDEHSMEMLIRGTVTIKEIS